ncbi:protein phosphatase CheZ [Candidatus Saccharibacteria bacterium]|nr:protein phosphatase CheZ [Candidatus Saccharibacteria bacterium]NCS82866.1 protein phosphatase CheZ [Candidatus Saccharibacteria bacterium]
MDPNQQVPANYLDQIATKPQKNGLVSSKFRKIFIVLGGLVIAVIILSIIGALSGGGRSDAWYQLVARLNATAEVADSSNGKIKSSQLRSLNSEIRIFITNTNRDITGPLDKMKIDPKKVPEKIATNESAQPMLDRLEDARLNAVYDRTYAREMTYQLALILSQLRQMYDSASDEETKAFLETAFDNLQATHTSLANYSESTN